MDKKALALRVIEGLKQAYPEATCTLDYNEAWKLLVSVRLAAQCTDARVNGVTRELFAVYPSVEALAEAPVEEIERLVHPCGLGPSKARDISACMRVLRDTYGGRVPEEFDQLLALPGVGRKSANLIMGDVFGKPAIVTDTHCIRLSNRIGLVEGIREPAKVEKALWQIVPPEEGNDLCHRMDPSRFTTLACYAMCGPFNKVAHITDVVSWNLYLGWYVPGFKLNDLWIDFFHKVYPNRCLGYSEYGAEAMTTLHSAKPRRGDQTEEYQALYHEYLLECFAKRPFMWATHVWNMFDFAADARDQGGEPGMNHKGLVTFDRRTKKDSFYLYKAWWNEKDPFVHICSKRFADRAEAKIEIKVYSNQKSVTL